MAASYPSSAKSFSTKATNDVIEASHPNDLQDEVTAIETALLTGLAHDLLPDGDGTRKLGSAALSWDGSEIINLSASNITGGVLPIGSGGTGAALVDPNADRLLFWDDSAGAFAFLTPGTGLTISGTDITGTPVIYDKDLTEQTVSNSSSLTSVYSKSVLANTLVAGKAFRILMKGVVINTSGGSVNLTVTLSYGGTTVVAGTLAIGNGTNPGFITFDCLLNANNAGNSQRAEAFLSNTGNIADGSMTSSVAQVRGGHSSLAVDATADKTLDISIQWASGSSSITFKQTAVLVELLS
jgi:hypothetical protein